MSEQLQQHEELLSQFITLANQLKDQGTPPQAISAAMMSATAVYTTYVHAGNEGYLHDTGIAKAVNAYEKHVRHIQSYKKAMQAQGQEQGQERDQAQGQEQDQGQQGNPA